MSIDRVPPAQSVPESLREREQWVCWRTEHRDGEPTKVPIEPVAGGFASTSEPDSWRAFGVARGYAAAEDTTVDGVGFVFTEADPFVGVDLDDCRDPETGSLDESAASIVDRLESYTEVSPSGTGVHVLLRGELPEGRNRRGKIELYDQGRYFTVTGARIDGAPRSVAAREDALATVHAEHVAREDDGRDEEPAQDGADMDSTGNGNSAPTPGTGTRSGPADLTDDELLERAMAAANGDKFRRLWNGDTSGYDSHSEADLALCCLLAFWTGTDTARIDRLFRRSGLMRPKWDEVHYGDDRTYGEGTIEEAVAFVSETYDPEDDSVDAGDVGSDTLPSRGDDNASTASSRSGSGESAPVSPPPTDTAGTPSTEDATANGHPDPAEDVTVSPGASGDSDGSTTGSDGGGSDDGPAMKEVREDAVVVYGDLAEAIEDLRASIAELYEENEHLRERITALENDADDDHAEPEPDR